MKAPFESGEVVVCVDDRTSKQIITSRHTILRKNSVYRVSDVWRYSESEFYVLIDGEERHKVKGYSVLGGWSHKRFRKIDEDVTEDFRKLLASLPKQLERT